MRLPSINLLKSSIIIEVRTFFVRAIVALFIAGFLSACGSVVQSGGDTTATVPEASYCVSGSKSAGSNPLTITGVSARYQYYATISEGGSTGLSNTTSTQWIPYAEVVITDSTGNIVQCSETDASGVVTSFQIPKVAGTYTLSVNSRSFNAKNKVSVLQDVSSNSHYSASMNFTVTGSEGSSKNLSSIITATVSSSSRLGAAFHILYNIYLANEYLRSTLSDPSFVTEKVSIYWKAGFNPGAYVGTSSPLSFYIQGSRQLYILGGSNGDSSTSDFDHFDDSVILHEFGHFLEDVYSKSDSQGGSHNGNFIIDPRLAWSEGWANFFQAAVIRSVDTTRGKYYIDTVGGAIAIKFNLSVSGGSTTYDQVTQAGEGTFREVSVSRTLWKAIAPAAAPTAPSPAGAEIPFAAVWKIFSDSSAGIKNPLQNFRNIGLFNSLFTTEITSNYNSKLTAWGDILNNEKQNSTTHDYADAVSVQASCGSYPRDILPVADSTFASIPRSNLLRSNDFYLFYYSGGGGTINLTYTTTNPPASASNIDLDLYVYKQGYVYQEDYHEAIGYSTGGVVLKSDRAYGTFETGSESVPVSSLSPGYYLINVKANTYNKTLAQVNGTAAYTLTLTQGSTSYLCPAN